MKRAIIVGMALACSLAVLGCAAGQQAAKSGPAQLAPMTTNDITALSKAGISDTVIVAMMTASGSQFNLKASDIIALADSGVSDNVIDAMIKTGDNSKQVDQSPAVYPYPWYPYYAYAYPYYIYDPFWDPWYYPWYSVRVGFNYGFHGGFGVHGGHRGGRHH
jgi:hypothetical protein